MVFFMRIEQFEYISDLAKTSSITNSAERFNISQPSMSLAIAAIEEELGIKIFKRSRSGTHPTESGKEIIEKIGEILQSIEELKEMGHNQKSLVTGRLSIGASPSIWLNLLPKSLTSFTKKYPGVEFSVSAEDSPLIRQNVIDGKLDLGIIAHFTDYVEQNKNLSYRRLLKSKMMACVGQHSPLANKSSVSLTELLKYPLVSDSPQFREWLTQFGKPNFLYKSDHLEVAKSIIVEGFAVGFYPKVHLKGDFYVQTGKLIPLEITDTHMKELAYSLIQRKAYKSIASQEFIKELDNQLTLFQHIWF
jgi:DNA-binding transcriptional LysR family regulator